MKMQTNHPSGPADAHTSSRFHPLYARIQSLLPGGILAAAWLLLVAALPGSAAETAPDPTATRPPAKKRFLLNNDGTNLLWRDDLTPEMVRRHAAECPNEVTTYLVCPNGIQKMMYPSAHEELATRGKLPALVQSGIDPFGLFLSELKTRGFETMITFRMNEVHNVNDPQEPDLSAFWRQHPEYRVARGQNPNDWMSQCLDYSLAPVREYSLRLLEELMEKYQPDGIKLDWMRFPRHLGGTREAAWGQRQHLTEVVQRVRAKAGELGRKLGRPLLVAVRVPTSLAGCRALGVDIADWAGQDLIDFLTAAPFLTTDFAMPLDELRLALAGRPVPIYAGIEFGYGGQPHREETLRAAALGLHASGADGIYLFNFPCWRETKPHPYWSWIPQLNDPVRLRGRELHLPMVDGMHRVAGIDLPAPLPLDLPPGESRNLVLRVPGLALAPQNQPRQASLLIEPAAAIACTVNGTALAEGAGVPLPALRPGDNVLSLANRGASPVRITRVELRTQYPLVAPRPAGDGTARVFHLSPSGSDQNDGSPDKPFQSLARAREILRQQPPSGDVTFYLQGGIYRLAQPLVLSAADIGSSERRVRFRAWAGEQPVLSGGRLIPNWRRQPDGKWMAPLAEGEFRQLYVNGRRAVRARGHCPPGVERFGGLDFCDAEAGHLFPDGGLAGWRNPADIELGYFNSWSHMICRVAEIRSDLTGRARVRMQQPWFFLASRKEGVQAKDPAYMENAYELLDEPGEWYHDRAARTIYYLPRPGEDMASAEVVAPFLETLLVLAGTPPNPVRNVEFQGITFADATWLRPNRIGHPDVQANFIFTEQQVFQRDGWLVNLHNEYLKSPANVVLQAAENCRFERCTFTRLGGAGLDLEHGSCHNLVHDCSFYDISGSAIQIGNVDTLSHHPADPRWLVSNNTVANNRIHHIGVEYEDSVGIFAGYTRGTVVAHNELDHLPYSGVSLGWGWGEQDAGAGAYSLPFRYQKPTPAGGHRIECNHIHQVMLRRHDGGAIYTLGNQPGTVIRNNHLHDNGPGGPGGIYLDEGSGFIEITGNVVYQVATPMVYNNRAQDRLQTCFEHDNFFNVKPEADRPAMAVVNQAGRDQPAAR